MTINEMIQDMVDKETDTKKRTALENLSGYIAYHTQIETSAKLNARKIFSLCEELMKEWPEFVTAVMSLAMLGLVGVQSGQLEVEDGDFNNADITKLIEEDD